jgi:hypothetical protein
MVACWANTLLTYGGFWFLRCLWPRTPPRPPTRSTNNANSNESSRMRFAQGQGHGCTPHMHGPQRSMSIKPTPPTPSASDLVSDNRSIPKYITPMTPHLLQPHVLRRQRCRPRTSQPMTWGAAPTARGCGRSKLYAQTSVPLSQNLLPSKFCFEPVPSRVCVARVPLPLAARPQR